MCSLLRQFLAEWNSGKNQRAKLQQAYVLLIIVLAVAAGFLSLLRGDLGRIVIMTAIFLAVVYVCNAIAWALLDAFISPILPKHDTSSARKSKTSR